MRNGTVDNGVVTTTTTSSSGTACASSSSSSGGGGAYPHIHHHHLHHLKVLSVELLTGEVLSVPFEGKTICSAIWNRVEGELVVRGVVHPQIFGLAIKSGLDWVFVDPDAKLSKYYVCKDDRGKSSSLSVNDGKPAFYCRVHFYLDALPQNFDAVSLQHYYLQLRGNLLSAPRYPPASTIGPLALALQTEVGDAGGGGGGGGDLPSWASLHPQRSALARAHASLAGMDREGARLAFIRASMPSYNMHLFPMTLNKTKGAEKNAPAWIGVTPKGIEVYQNVGGCLDIPASPRLTFLWANITKLYFERKKYGIRGRAFPWAHSTQKLSFTASSESVPQHLLTLCRSTHQFHLSNASKILATMSSESSTSSGNSTLQSSKGGGEDKMLDLSLWAEGLLLTGAGESSDGQRVSVISNASSNTTSGIGMSDRVYSLDGSDEDGEGEPCACHKKSGCGCEEDEDEEAKYWYCDSDCEDCDDSGCLQKRRRRRRRGCAGHYDDEGGCSHHHHHRHYHQGTPSMASETTLKAVDLEEEEEEEGTPEEYKLDEEEEGEHVYGEISEDPNAKYSTIDETPVVEPPKPKPRTSKASKPSSEPPPPNSSRGGGCKCSRLREKCCHVVRVKNGGGGGHSSKCSLTPRVASLKCLKKPIKPCSQVRRHISSIRDHPQPPSMNYVELTQGSYPSTRSVSDNFDTDSDYVQLPPLSWYAAPPAPAAPAPPRPKKPSLWKCVSSSSSKPKQVTPPSLSPPVVNIHTLPRRKPGEDPPLLLSRSTNALHLVSSSKPEPPPKPRMKSLVEDTTLPVDARFIATRPQILIQTAYATTAPVAVPSQAQVLVRKAQGHPPPIQHSQSLDNIYDTVACEDRPTTNTGTATTPPPYKDTSLVIRPNNYIDVHASSKGGGGKKKPVVTQAIANHYIQGSNKTPRVGSVPNNLNDFLRGLQNLKPLSRTPIVHPGATSSSCASLNTSHHNPPPPPRFVYTTNRELQSFKAQLLSDLDYVIFPQKDPRLSQQEYFDSKTGTTGDIPPPYLPPPPPYPVNSSLPPPLPKKNLKPHSGSNRGSLALGSSSYGSLYHGGGGSTTGGSSCYSALNLNSENLSRFLSSSNVGSPPPPIYYASSTQSAPPLPPYKHSSQSQQVLIENGMRKALLSCSNSRERLKLCRSEESLYSQPANEEALASVYNLPPPPPYKKPLSFTVKQEAASAAELDLAHLKARCHALELPLLRALCSEGELLNKNTSTKALIAAAKNRIRPIHHPHPPPPLTMRLSIPPNPLPIPPKPTATPTTTTRSK